MAAFPKLAIALYLDYSTSGAKEPRNAVVRQTCVFSLMVRIFPTVRKRYMSNYLHRNVPCIYSSAAIRRGRG